MIVLTGDIGGTKTLLVMFEVDGADLRAIKETRFDTGGYEDFVSTVRAACDKWRRPIDGACFAVAGPIVGDRFTGTNLGWSVEIDRFKQDIGIPHTILMNDFCAVGHGIVLLAGRGVRILQTGTHRQGEPIAVIGAGTGLGEGYLTWEGDRYRVHPSEGGHCDFAPRGLRQTALLEYLRKIHDHVSYEKIVSGPGLVDIYEFFIDTGIATESRRIAAEMERKDPAAVISHHAQEEDDNACIEALDLFVSIYGAEAGNLALKVLATGGVYIAGGIAPRITYKLQDGTFVRAFCDKGWHRDLLAEIPVAVVLNPRTGLLGAARVAADALASSGSG